MAEAPQPPSHPMRWLAAKLLATTLLAAGVYVLFTVFNHVVLKGFSAPEILLLEAVAVVLIAYAVARAVTTATTAAMARRGLVSHSHAVRLFLNILIAIVAIVALFDLAGVSVESIFLGSAFAGIVLGLAAQTVLANVFAGLLLVFADPFHPGDRVTFVSSSYPAIAPSYPHELQYPGYSGIIEDVGLIYTVLRLDSGAIARLPNSVVIGSLLIEPRASSVNVHRVRLSFPIAVPVATVEGALPDLAKALPRPTPLDPPPRFEVADISSATWDGVFLVSSTGREEGEVRDVVLRLILPRLPGAALSAPSRASATP